MEQLNQNDFPSVFQAADSASINAQKNYTQIIACDILSMVIASALGIYNYQQNDSKLYIYIISGILLLIGLVLTIIIRTKQFEDIWYQGRALAESCKTLSWRFITCSETFEHTMGVEDAKQVFINRIRDLSNEFRDLNRVMCSRLLSLPIVTDKMVEIRRMSTIERKKFYIENRLNNQKEWYSLKAEFNKKKYNMWFVVIIISQLLSSLCVLYLILHPSSNWNLIGLFTTISSSALSWLQMKQHQELKQAYTTTVQELNMILAGAERIYTDTELSKFVLDSENAISREHTLWLAQKRH